MRDTVAEWYIILLHSSSSGKFYHARVCKFSIEIQIDIHTNSTNVFSFFEADRFLSFLEANSNFHLFEPISQ